jgi:hypothetical protein
MNTKYKFLSNDDIGKELAKKFEKIRISKELSEFEVATKGGTNTAAIYRFKKTGKITLTNFIMILKGIGELDNLEQLMNIDNEYSPIPQAEMKTKKRIMKKKENNNNEFKWGDE